MASIKSFSGISGNGLLGYGSNPQMSSLLGIDPAEMRKQALLAGLSGGLTQAGAALMGTKNYGQVGAAFLNGVNSGRDDYRRNAILEYQMKQAADDRAYNRGRDAESDRRWKLGWDYNTGRAKKADARDAYSFEQQVEADQRAADQRQGTQDYVTGWMGEQNQQGAGLPMSPGVRSIGRQGGVDGPSATDLWRYNNAEPYAGAQQFDNAFQQITAQPPAMTPAQTRKFRRGDQEITQEFDPSTGGWTDIATGSAFNTSPDTQVTVMPNGEPPDGTLRKQLSTKEGELWNTYKSNADTAGGLVQDLEALDELAKVAPNGPLTGRLAEMFPGFSSAGDAYQSIILRAAPNLRVAGSGSTSDIEYEGMLKSFPMLRNTPQGNAVISAVMKRKADITIMRGQIVDQYLNGDLSAVDARKQLTALNRQSIIDPAMRQLIQATSGKSPAEMSDDEIRNQLNGGAN